MKLKLIFPCPHVQFVCLKSVTGKSEKWIGRLQQRECAHLLFFCIARSHNYSITAGQ